MKRKAAEEEFRELIKSLGGDWQKYRDLMFCKYCGKEQWKADEKPDFQFTIKGRSYLCEVKQSNKAWVFTDKEGSGIRNIQRQELDRWEKEHNPCFLFISLGPGPAPHNRSAWLVPWGEWKIIEQQLLEKGQKSLARIAARNIGAIDLLWKWELVWKKGEGIWSIPPNHDFYKLVGGLSDSKNENTFSKKEKSLYITTI